MEENSIQLGNIQIENHLPDVLKDENIRNVAKVSLDRFKENHGGELPLKFKIEEFCFQRQEQICTVDSARKYLAWSGEAIEITERIFSGLTQNDLPLMLRSHMVEFGIQTPMLQITEYEDVVELLSYMKDPRQHSIIGQHFFEKIDLSNTVIELLKNPYEQKGLFLCRATFIYDKRFIEEITLHKDLYEKAELSVNVPREFMGFRVVLLKESAREKKIRIGNLFIYDADKECFGTNEILPPELDYLKKVLQYQIPKIVDFEKEIRSQSWIPQGLSNTHQFVMYPSGEIDTQYYDFRPHQSIDELRKLASEIGVDFDSMSVEDKIKMFF